MYRAVMALNGTICDFAFGPSQDGKQRLIAPVNIVAEFQVASVIYESGLVGQVDRDEAWKRDIDFIAAKHSMDAVLAVTFAWPYRRQQYFGIFHGILYPHAAVAFGAPLIAEQVFLIQVVLVDRKLIRKIETELPECVLFPGRLGEVDGAVRIVAYPQPHSLQYCWILLQ